MKTAIVNTLVLILIFNLIMIIFPEGKTQKFCRISIKLLIMIFILDNVFLSGNLDINPFKTTEAPVYQREVNVKNISPQLIDSINQTNFQGEEVVSDMIISLTENMEMSLRVNLLRMVENDELNKLKINLAEIFQLKSDNIEIREVSLYE